MNIHGTIILACLLRIKVCGFEVGDVWLTDRLIDCRGDISGNEEASGFRLQIRPVDPYCLSQARRERISSIHVDISTA